MIRLMICGLVVLPMIASAAVVIPRHPMRSPDMPRNAADAIRIAKQQAHTRARSELITSRFKAN